jgi:hypothetical protein
MAKARLNLSPIWDLVSLSRGKSWQYQEHANMQAEYVAQLVKFFAVKPIHQVQEHANTLIGVGFVSDTLDFLIQPFRCTHKSGIYVRVFTRT